MSMREGFELLFELWMVIGVRCPRDAVCSGGRASCRLRLCLDSNQTRSRVCSKKDALPIGPQLNQFWPPRLATFDLNSPDLFPIPLPGEADCSGPGLYPQSELSKCLMHMPLFHLRDYHDRQTHTPPESSFPPLYHSNLSFVSHMVLHVSMSQLCTSSTNGYTYPDYDSTPARVHLFRAESETLSSYMKCKYRRYLREDLFYTPVCCLSV